MKGEKVGEGLLSSTHSGLDEKKENEMASFSFGKCEKMGFSDIFFAEVKHLV